MQQLRRYFPVMPTWVNIESVMIVQPNGKILSQYREMSQRQRTIKLSVTKKETQQSSIQMKEQQSSSSQTDSKSPVSNTKKHHKQKLQLIAQRVIQSSRKLFRDVYQSQLNKVIVDNTLVYYRAKHNVIVIVVVKKFSVLINQIQQLMNKVFNWYYEKCIAMNIQIKLPNSKIGQYEEGQFKKLQWEIANEIDQKASIIQKTKSPKASQKPKQQLVQQKFSLISQNIFNRNDQIKQIGEKVFFHDIDPVNSRQSMKMNKHSKITKLLAYFFPSFIEQKQPKTRKFKRQLSFMEKSVLIAKEMRIRLLLFYFCLIISLVLGGMVYFGWFQQNED